MHEASLFYLESLGDQLVRGICVRCAKTFVQARRGSNKIYCGEGCRAAASKQRNGERFRKYGLTLAEYEVFVEACENRCQICGEEPKKSDRYALVVDHDHASGKIRGLLCNRCNMGIGLFDDDPEKLNRAIRYLMVQRPA